MRRYPNLAVKLKSLRSSIGRILRVREVQAGSWMILDSHLARGKEESQKYALADICSSAVLD